MDTVGKVITTITLLLMVIVGLVGSITDVPKGWTVRDAMIKSGMIKWVLINDIPEMVLQDEVNRPLVEMYRGWGMGVDLILKKSEVK